MHVHHLKKVNKQSPQGTNVLLKFSLTNTTISDRGTKFVQNDHHYSIQTETENKEPKVIDTKVESISVVFSFYQPTL